MSEATTPDPVPQAPEATDEAPDTEAQDEAQEEKTLKALLRKAESAFAKGGKALLISRVECGKHCHAVYAYRLEQGHKDRAFTSKLIFNRLSVHADSARECDATLLAKLFKTVDLLADNPWDKKHDQPWHALTLGKLEDLSALQGNPLVTHQHNYQLPPVGRSLWHKVARDCDPRGIKAKTLYPQRPESWPKEDTWPPDKAFALV